MNDLPSFSTAQSRLGDVLNWSQGLGAEPLLLEVIADDLRQQLQMTTRLRHLPGRRLVAAGSLITDAATARPVVVKWFFGQDALRYAERERQGVALLRHAAVPTADLYACWRFDGGCALVFEQLIDAQPIDDERLAQYPTLWSQLWALLGQLHNAGVTHNDLHFGNLLWRAAGRSAPTNGHSLWLIDGDAAKQVASRALSFDASLQAFAQLAAQARESVRFAALVEHWSSYCSARGWAVDRVGPSALQRAYASARRARILHFQAKTRRTCSAFAERRTLVGTALIDREWLGDTQLAPQIERTTQLLQWLDALPEWVGHGAVANATVLKAGNTATVVTASWEGRPLVVKRYNNKSWWHWLRRLLRPNRGLNSWVFAHTLRFLGIPTARTVALLRTRMGGPTFLVMEASGGTELQADHLEASENLCQRLVSLLARLGDEGLVHNDTKISNFLWDAERDLLAVIDLDAMQMPASSRAQLSGQKLDRRRLLRNFAATPELQRRFRGALEL